MNVLIFCLHRRISLPTLPKHWTAVVGWWVLQTWLLFTRNFFIGGSSSWVASSARLLADKSVSVVVESWCPGLVLSSVMAGCRGVA